MSSVYEQLGGKAAIDAAVDEFYRRVLKDEELSPYFSDIDMDKQRAKQAGFLTMVTGGPNEYTGRDMRTAHARLVERGIGDRHVDLVIKHCHRELRGSRGVVMSLAAFSVRDETMTWVGVGNVTGLLLRADQGAERPRETLLSRGGVVGYNLPSLYPVVHSVYPGDTLVFASDGLRSGFTDGVILDDSPQQIADHLLENYSRGTDDALVLVARYIGGGAE